ncbi:hypothetical protein LCL95_04925 [Bacillus timonensis]|nr:hypothetical protein [Bacillus timonensis]
MEYKIDAKDSAIPCEITIDDDNGRYMVRNADTSGQSFNSAKELVSWIEQNWKPEDFNNQSEYCNILSNLKENISKL